MSQQSEFQKTYKNKLVPSEFSIFLSCFSFFLLYQFHVHIVISTLWDLGDGIKQKPVSMSPSLETCETENCKAKQALCESGFGRTKVWTDRFLYTYDDIRWSYFRIQTVFHSMEGVSKSQRVGLGWISRFILHSA